MVECAEEILGMPVRLGFPVGVKGLVQLVQGPQYATGVGLVRYGAAQLAEAQVRQDGLSRHGPGVVVVAPEPAKRGGGFFDWFKAAF
jgi:cell division protein FtsA